MKTSRRLRRRSQPKWHAQFLAMLPAIRRYVLIAFRDLAGDHRDEAVQEAIVNACVACARLARQGRSNRAFPTALARFAVAQVREGRTVGTPLNVRDVLSRYAQLKKSFVVARLDRFNASRGEWVEAVIVDPRTPVLDQVCFRIDFPEWLSRLSRRNRRIAKSLAVGSTTGEVARRFRLSPARISQLRRELHESWKEFQGEADGSEHAAVCAQVA